GGGERLIIIAREDLAAHQAAVLHDLREQLLKAALAPELMPAQQRAVVRIGLREIARALQLIQREAEEGRLPRLEPLAAIVRIIDRAQQRQDLASGRRLEQ